MAYFTDIGNNLGSWINTSSGGEPAGSPYMWVSSGTAYNYKSGTQGYQFEDNSGFYNTGWKQNFNGTFPEKGSIEFSVAMDAGSAPRTTFGIAGYFSDGYGRTALGPRFGTEFLDAGSIWDCWSAGDIGSYFASGTYITFKYVYDFGTYKTDIYKDGIKVVDQGTFGSGTNFYITAGSIDRFRISDSYGNWEYKFRLDDIFINETVSNILLNAAIHCTTQNDCVCNAKIYRNKTNIDFLKISGQNYTTNYSSFRFTKKLSQQSDFECSLVGIYAADKVYVKKGSTVIFYSENPDNLTFKGEVTSIEYLTDYDCVIRGTGKSINISRRNVSPSGTEGKSSFTKTDSDTIINTLLSVNDDASSPYLLTPGQIDDYSKITIRFENEDKLTAMSYVSEQIGLDWWVDNVNDTSDTFNFGLKSITPVMTLYTGGANQNCYKVSFEEDTENLANYVVGLGYGDGINQLSTTYYDASPISTTISGTQIPAYSSDANTNFLYHFENNGTDSGPNGFNLGVSGAVTYISSGNKIGSYSVGEMATGSYFVYTGSPYDGWLYGMASGTFESWVYPSGLSKTNYLTKNAVVDVGAPAKYVFGAYCISGGKVRFFFDDTTPVFYINSTNTIPVHQWSHIATSWNVENNEARIYINGELDSIHNGSFYIGSVAPTSRRIGGFAGYLDEMRLSNSVRTSFNAGGPFITESQTYIPALNVSSFSPVGSLNIGNEIIYYTNTGTNSFEGCTRGAGSSTAKTHPIKALIYKYVSSGAFWADKTASESGSSIYEHGIRTIKLEDKTIDSDLQLQLNASNYLTGHKNEIIRMTVEVADVRTTLSTVDVGDWVTVDDTDINLDGDYKVVGIEMTYAEDGEQLFLELSNRKSVLLEELFRTKRNQNAQSNYAQGSTNVFQIGPYSDNAVGGTTGFDNPLNLRFYIPSDAKNLSTNNIVKLNWKQTDFESTVSGATPTLYSYTTDNVPVYIKVDGTDRTTALGGPWSGTEVTDLNIASYITLGGYHTVQLSPSGTSPRKITVDGWAQVYIK